MPWDYAKLSKAAKSAGGPEKFVDALAKTSRAAGREEMIPWLLIALLAGAGISCAAIKFHEKHKSVQTSMEEAKSQLVQAIKKYDATHSYIKDEAVVNDLSEDCKEENDGTV